MNFNNSSVGFASGKFNHNADPAMKPILAERISGEKNPMFGRTHSDEYKQRLRDFNKGENHAFYGKHHSDETKQLISKANTGKKWNEEQRKRHSELLKEEYATGKRKPNI